MGSNTVVITVVDLRGNRSSTTVNFTFEQRFALTVNRIVPDGVTVDTASAVILATLRAFAAS